MLWAKPKVSIGILIVIIVCVLVLFLLSAKWDTISEHPFYDTLYLPLSSAIVALLVVAITIYIFLYNGLTELKQSNPYLIKTVDKVKSYCRYYLIGLVFVGMISFAFGITLSNTVNTTLYTPNTSVLVHIYIVLSFLAIGSLLWYNAYLIDYDALIVYQAKKFLGIPVESIKTRVTSKGVDELNEFANQFANVMCDLHMICERIKEQSSDVASSLPEDRRLAYALKYRYSVKEDKDIDKFAKKYQYLSDVFDYIKTAMKYDSEFFVSDTYVPLNDARRLERTLVGKYMSGGLFEDVVITGKNYIEPDFRYTSFNKSLLDNVKLTRATLDGATFQDCRMQNVYLSVNSTEIKDVNFSGAVFIDFKHSVPIKFVNSVFINADFTGNKELVLINFEMSALENINLGDCSLERLSFFRCSACGANMTNSRINNVDFAKGNFSDAIFESALIRYHYLWRIDYKNDDRTFPSMQGAKFSGANMFRVSIKNANMGHARLERINLNDAILTDCIIESAYCDDANFSHSVLNNVDLTRSLLNRADFSHMELSGKSLLCACLCNDALFIETSIIGTPGNSISFANAQFRNAQFVGGEYKHCDFSGVIFDGAMLSSESKFIACDFTGASFKNADVLARFSECVFTGARFDSEDVLAVFDDKCIDIPIDYTTSDNLKCNVPLEIISETDPTSNTPCFDTILSRKSTRSFANVPTPKEIIYHILEAARWAPSAKNRQPWHYCVITSAEEIKRISGLLESKGPSVLETSKAICRAGALILVGRGFGYEVENTLPDYLSIGASVENMLLAATEIGFDSLWVCDILEIQNEIRSEINFQYELVCAVCLGHKNDADNGRTRKDLGEIAEFRGNGNIV